MCLGSQRCVLESGVCVASGTEACAIKSPSNPDGGTCTVSASNDTTCNGIDDDCDGQFDENYASQTLHCGVGSCARTQLTSCVNGAVTGLCMPGVPAAHDATCDGIDDDCDSQADENFAGQVSRCGVGACAAAGMTRCVSAVIDQGCTPAPPGNSDASCDGHDDDCDGTSDEDVQTQSIACGIGACAATGTKSCIQGVFIDSCTLGNSGAADSICNGIDDDCDGRVDEEYMAQVTICGIGACRAQGQTSCLAGVIANSCQSGMGAPLDGTCNGVDDDCDGEADDDVSPVDVQCGVGGCTRTGSLQCVNGSLQSTCVAGAPLGQDASCNGVDDDCDGGVDESYVARVASCGIGACAATGTTLCSNR